MILRILTLYSLAIMVIGCGRQKTFPPGWVDEDRLLQADAEPGNWMSLGRNFMQQHHSPLEQINRENVSELGLAWEYATEAVRGKVNRGLEATPIVVDGIMYTSGSWSIVFALDAKTGREIWRYDPKVDGNYARRACCDVVNRGVQVWKGKVYVGTLDGYLVCLDAATGKLLWKQDTFTDRTAFYTITGPPQMAKGKVIIGNSGAEFGVRGYVTAYDAETGKFAWRFYTVPGDPKKGFEHPEMELASKTWDPNSDWQAGGGGTVWGEMAYDPQLNLLYVGTGNATPYPIWYRSPSGGDNLFLVSILAINPDNGKMAWHYQTTPGEIWDFTATMNMVLANLKIGGQERKVLMQAPKNGFFYVLDRTNGKLISARKFVPVNWADSVDLETGRPVVNPRSWYKDSAKYIFPGPAGGHSWPPMSYSPQTGLVYIPTADLPFVYENEPNYRFRPGKDNMYARQISAPLPSDYAHYAKGWPEPEYEVLKAWDPVEQKEVWRAPYPGTQNGGTQNGGVLSTDGKLVFQGSSTGHLLVYDAENGKLLKDIFTGTGIQAAPISYEVDGEQYVAVMAGFGGAVLFFPGEQDAIAKYRNEGRILAFKLNGGTTPLPREQMRTDTVPAPPNMQINAQLAEQGKALYSSLCVHCHSSFGKNHYSELPDLSAMSATTHEWFSDILLQGKLSYYGMASFSDVLSTREVEALHQFLVSVQQQRYREQQAGKEKP
ncbi:MAG: PQQ-dependent dehydrogenase, methanol/ethanol family [Chitinophagaceae bacterium]|nr:PQQ-dependent dehydrogenase, methanol/ethanol family [Chitinophagaceae bacterium]